MGLADEEMLAVAPLSAFHDALGFVPLEDFPQEVSGIYAAWEGAAVAVDWGYWKKIALGEDGDGDGDGKNSVSEKPAKMYEMEDGESSGLEKPVKMYEMDDGESSASEKPVKMYGMEDVKIPVSEKPVKMYGMEDVKNSVSGKPAKMYGMEDVKMSVSGERTEVRVVAAADALTYWRKRMAEVAVAAVASTTETTTMQSGVGAAEDR